MNLNFFLVSQNYWKDLTSTYLRNIELDPLVRLRSPGRLKTSHRATNKGKSTTSRPDWSWRRPALPAPPTYVIKNDVTRSLRDGMCLGLVYTSYNNTWSYSIVPCNQPLIITTIICIKNVAGKRETWTHGKAMVVNMDNIQYTLAGQRSAIQLCPIRGLPHQKPRYSKHSLFICDKKRFLNHGSQYVHVYSFYHDHNIDSYLARFCKSNNTEIVMCMDIFTLDRNATASEDRVDESFKQCTKDSLHIGDTCFRLTNVTGTKLEQSNIQGSNLTGVKRTNISSNLDIIELLNILSKYNSKQIVTALIQPHSKSHNALLHIDSSTILLTLSSPDTIVDKHSCPVWLFMCADQSCIYHSQIHDGENNCVDGSDEESVVDMCVIEEVSGTRQGTQAECEIYRSPTCQCTTHSYQCPEGGCVPWERVCDSVPDCIEAGDEICLGNFTNLIPSRFPQNRTSPMKENITSSTECIASYYCPKNKKCIPNHWVNDGIEDCPTTTISEEPGNYIMERSWVQLMLTTQSVDASTQYIEKYTNIRDISVLYMDVMYQAEDENVILTSTSTTRHLLMCHTESSQTFSFLQLCILDYDDFGQIKPCRSASHLQYCDKMECGRRFKCPGSYCISHIRVCDSFMDCPEGTDEEGCGEGPPHCPGMFRCPGGLCIHPDQLCDIVLDCPNSGFDELFCRPAPCPESCICKGYFMNCENTAVHTINASLYRHVMVKTQQCTQLMQVFIGMLWCLT